MSKIYLAQKLCNGCKACEFACSAAQHQSQNPFLAITEDFLPEPLIKVLAFGTGFLPIHCRHCEEAPCTAACMAGALQYNPEGLVVQDGSKCVGCWMCVMVCPFGAVISDFLSHRSRKCQGCTDLPEPPCITACSPKALHQNKT